MATKKKNNGSGAWKKERASVSNNKTLDKAQKQ